MLTQIYCKCKVFNVKKSGTLFSCENLNNSKKREKAYLKIYAIIKLVYKNFNNFAYTNSLQMQRFLLKRNNTLFACQNH